MKRLLSTTARSNKIHEASLKRKEFLDVIYVKRFQGLSQDERVELAKSGQVWWNYSGIENYEVKLSEQTKLQLKELDQKAKNVHHHNPLNDMSSPVWKSFRLMMTHNSTALEGNSLTQGETGIAIDEYAEGISKGLGISQADKVSPKLSFLIEKDVREVVNHAAAMEYLKSHLFTKQSLTAADIVELHSRLMPAIDPNFIFEMRGLDSDHLFRRVPVHVTASAAVRPYPHEIPALMTKLLNHQKSSRMQSYHPVVATILFATDFLHIHPFEDGNGRTARLLLVLGLYKSGYVGCIIQNNQRAEYLAPFDKYFLGTKDCDPMISFVVSCTNSSLSDLHYTMNMFQKKINDLPLMNYFD
jgi:Fic family protein